MRFEEVTRAAVTQDSLGSLHYRRPNKKQLFFILFLLFWVVGATVGGGGAVAHFLANGPSDGKLFLVLWSLAWALGVAYATAMLLWMTIGSESITANPLAFTHTLHMGPLKYERHYRPDALSNLRWRDGSSWPAFTYAKQSKPSAILADYGAKTIAFLRGMDQPEATQLLDRLLPALGMRRAST